MRLYLVPCNAMANGTFVAEDVGIGYAHSATGGGITQAMKLHLVTWPVGLDETGERKTLFVSGKDQFSTFMKIHLAEHDPQHHSWPKNGVDKAEMKLKILLSYWYYKDTDLDVLFEKYFTKPYPEVFADSGGFSAFTQGVDISWEEYADWLKRWRHIFSVTANLDVIGNHEETMKNQRRLESKGLNPIPVFHTGSDYADLEALTEEYPYIALGGLVPYMRYTEKVMPHLIKCFRIASGKSVFHGFGVTSWKVLKALPWYSVDSSSWGSGFRYGQVPIFDEKRGKFITLQLGDKVSWLKNSSIVRALGFNPMDFADRERNDRAKICAISALSYMRAERWLRKYHGPVVMPGKAQQGVRQVLADANPTRFGEIEQGAGVHLHLSDTSNGINYGDADTGLKLHLAEVQNNASDILAAHDIIKGMV